MLNLGRFCQKVHFQIAVDKHQCNRCQRKAYLFNLLGLTDWFSQERMSLQPYEQAGGGKRNLPIFFQNQRSLFQ